MNLRVLLLGLLATGAIVVGVTLLPASLAGATHPCPTSTAGRTYDPGVSSDHDACFGPPSPQAGDVVLRGPDSGTTVTVPVGRRLFVQLESGWTGPLWNDITGSSGLHRMLLDVQRPSTTAVFMPSRVSDSEKITAAGGPFAWSANVLVTDGVLPSPSPSACAPVPWNGPGTLTDADDGRTVTVTRGEVVVVAFPGCPAGYRQPGTADGPLYRYRAYGSNPGEARSIFSAVATGTATIDAEADARCLHTSPACAMAIRDWHVTVEVVDPPCELAGPVLNAVLPGHVVDLAGRVAPGASVTVWFHELGTSGWTARRFLTADADGRFATSYRGINDQRWYATAGDCTTSEGLTRIQPTVSGPPRVHRHATVPIVVRGPAGQPVQLYGREPGGDFRLLRTGRLDASGTYRTSYVADADLRYYARTGPDGRRTAFGLTQVD